MKLRGYASSAVLLASLCHCGGDASAPAADAAYSVPLLTVPECFELGGAPVGLMGVPGMGVYPGDPLVDSSSDDACPAMRRTIGTLESGFDDNGGLCCEIPPLLTAEDCEAAGGIALGDPGDGASLLSGCEGVTPKLDATFLGWLICERPDTFCEEVGICCQPR